MSTPQAPARRRRQKARRSKQLSAWRAKNEKKAKLSPAESVAPKSAAAAGKKTAAVAPKNAAAVSKKLASK